MSRFMRHGFHSIACVAAAVALGCSMDDPVGNQPANAPATKETQSVVVVSAAASTKDAVAELVEAFKKKSASDVQLNAGASNTLATQIIADAPADLFLSANRKWADEVDKAGKSLDSVPLLTNKLVLIVPKGNPAGVQEPADLLKAEVKRLALAGESVPAGMYAQQALTHLKLYDELTKGEKIARGQDVRTTLSYVERGEAEAGIVYSTDVLAAKEVETVYEFDPQTHEEIAYVLVLLKHSAGNAAAKDFYDYLASPEADAVWTKFGFERLTSSE